MTKYTKLGNDDNGTVLTAEEAILSGVASNRPQDICTKYPEKCTELQVAADDCGNCCNTVKPATDNCPDCPDCPDCPEPPKKLLYIVMIIAKDVDGKVEYYTRIYNPSELAITNLKVNVLCSASCNYVPVASPGTQVAAVGPGNREWIWEIDYLAPSAQIDLRIKTRYKGYALSVTPKADAPAELAEDSVLFLKHIIQ